MVKELTPEQKVADLLDRINYGTSIVELQAYGLNGEQAKVDYIKKETGLSEEFIRRVAVDIGYITYKKD